MGGQGQLGYSLEFNLLTKAKARMSTRSTYRYWKSPKLESYCRYRSDVIVM